MMSLCKIEKEEEEEKEEWVDVSPAQNVSPIQNDNNDDENEEVTHLPFSHPPPPQLSLTVQAPDVHSSSTFMLSPLAMPFVQVLDPQQPHLTKEKAIWLVVEHQIHRANQVEADLANALFQDLTRQIIRQWPRLHTFPPKHNSIQTHKSLEGLMGIPFRISDDNKRRFMEYASAPTYGRAPNWRRPILDQHYQFLECDALRLNLASLLFRTLMDRHHLLFPQPSFTAKNKEDESECHKRSGLDKYQVDLFVVTFEESKVEGEISSRLPKQLSLEGSLPWFAFFISQVHAKEVALRSIVTEEIGRRKGLRKKNKKIKGEKKEKSRRYESCCCGSLSICCCCSRCCIQ